MKITAPKHFGHTARSGFTIVEAVMVMVILGILGMIAVPRYAAFTATERLEAAARRITADLSLAQRQARRSSDCQKVSFNVASSRYSLVGLKHPDHPTQPFDINIGDEPYRARIVSASFCGNSPKMCAAGPRANEACVTNADCPSSTCDICLMYNGFGTPLCYGGTPLCSDGTAFTGGQIVIAVGAYQKTIQVDSGTGQPRKNVGLIIMPQEDPLPPEALQ